MGLVSLFTVITRDMKSLHETIHDLCSNSCLSGNIEEFMLGLAYEIRHAYQWDREKLNFGHDEYDQVMYRGVKLLWPVVIFQTALLEVVCGFQPTTKNNQANLYRLEQCVENVLIEYDRSVGQECIEWMKNFSGIRDDYLFLFVSETCFHFIFPETTGKKRFKKLPNVLYSFTTISKEYEKFIINIESLAKRKGVSP